MFTQSSVPTKILVGDSLITREHAEQVIRTALCPSKGVDCFCTICRTIKQGQHPAVRIFNPEKDYTVADIDRILEESRLARDPGELLFFVLVRAEALTTAAANRLLKLLEEPPQGYYFLLLTNNLESLLPTIVSRAQIIRLYDQASALRINPLVEFFCTAQAQTMLAPTHFEQLLAQEELTDAKSIELLQELFVEYAERAKKLILEEDPDEKNLDYIERVIDYLHAIMAVPPQSGSSSIFWKMVFMTFPRI